MARLNGGGWAAGILVAAALGAGLMMLAAGEEKRAFEKRFAEATIEGRAFGLACRETRPPADCEGLCRALFIEREAWAECVKAIVDPRLVGARPGADPAPDLEGGYELAPEKVAEIYRVQALHDCVAEDRPPEECDEFRKPTSESKQ